MSVSSIKIDVKGLLPLKRQLEILAMPVPVRRRMLHRVSKRVIADSKRRVRQQVDLQGRPFATRQRKRNRKMLSRLVKALKVVRNDSTKALIGFKGPVEGRIAAEQQHGITKTITSSGLSGTTKNTHHSPATRRQAKALRAASFTIKTANGKRNKSPSLKWVQNNMKIGQAGAALRYLREQAGQTIKQSWTTTLPARSFLGASATDISNHIDLIFNQMKQEVTRVAR